MVEGPASTRTVLLDTDVWSHLYVRRSSVNPKLPLWRRSLLGRTLVVATQTRAELIGGVFMSNWGDERTRATLQLIDETPVVPVDESVIQAHARLSADAKRKGHALYDKVHTGDRWIAASAIAFDIPLLSADGIFRDAPGLKLLDGEGQNL